MIPGEWVESPKLHPSLTHGRCGVSNEATRIRANEWDSKLIELEHSDDRKVKIVPEKRLTYRISRIFVFFHNID